MTQPEITMRWRRLSEIPRLAAQWLWRAKPALALILVPIALLRVTTLVYPDLEAIWLSGIILQCLGLLLVLYGLNQLGKLLGEPGILQACWQWFKSGSRMFRQAHYHMKIDLQAQAGVVVGAARLSAGPPSLAQRVAELESQIKDLAGRHDGLVGQLAEQMDMTRSEHRQGLEKITRKLGDIHLGTLVLEVLAILFIMIGTRFSSAPELSALFLAALGLCCHPV